MNKISKWWIATGAAVAVSAVIGIGVVMAQEPTPDATQTQDATPQAQQTPNAQSTPDSSTPGNDGDDRAHRSGCAGKGVTSAELAGFLGISETQLSTELEADGATLATVASAHGKDRAALIQFLTNQEKAELAARVAAGDLTQAQADDKLADFTADVDSIVDSAAVGHGHGLRGGAPSSITPSGT
jgi:hypothetical protein